MSLQKTPLYAIYRNTGCRIATFAGWEMPIQFSGLIDEHQAVREKAGLFDISHMGVFVIKGKKAKDKLQQLVPTDLYRIGQGEACYTVLLNENGGIIDDLIIYDLGHDEITSIESLLLVINAGCTHTDINWINQHIQNSDVSINDFKKDGIFIALQGPKSTIILEKFFQQSLSKIPRFGHKTITLKGKNTNIVDQIFVARTGYTGEEGFELLLKKKTGRYIWQELINQGITPCGLGARDTLRLEAAMHLYGHEINSKTTPFEAGLGWLVNLEMSSQFIGRDALEKQTQKGITQKLIGLKMHGKAIARKGYKIIKNNDCIGEITSGSWSPTLKRAIAMGYVQKKFSQPGTEINIEIRGKLHTGEVVKRPFYKKEK